MTGAIGSPEWIRSFRAEKRLTQADLASRLGVTLVTISRWENRQARPQKALIKALTSLAIAMESEIGSIAEPQAPYAAISQMPSIVDFRADSEQVRLFIEGQRLSYGHLFSPSFARETAMIDPLPHQIIAVERMLEQTRLRFLLADDAGAGKTIMTGLFISEMLMRRLIRRVLIVPPAGLVGNWQREMHRLFSLDMRRVTGVDCVNDNPFRGPGSGLIIISVDTLCGGPALQRLSDNGTEPYDLVVFDEAHKLAASRYPDHSYKTTERYRLAELLAGAEPLQSTEEIVHLPWRAHHLLLLTATPHMGKPFPYYALWRLLEPSVLRTESAFNEYPPEDRVRHFIRRTKEEMVRFDGSPIYPPRFSETASYELTALEWELYEATTEYVRLHYNKARILNRSAARLAMSVLQRRAASCTYSLLRSLERRRERLQGFINALLADEMTESAFQARQQAMHLADTETEKTGEEEQGEEGREEQEATEDDAMGATSSGSLPDLQTELEKVEALVAKAQRVYDLGEEAKFARLQGVINDPSFANEKLLIFTEHVDTLRYLQGQLEALGYTGQVAAIHGSMDDDARQAEIEKFRTTHRFMVGTDAAGEGINLQFCWIMVNYDIPWNPARIEQRFGRIHRYGQKHDKVVLVNLVAKNTREGKVLKTLLDKLEAIRLEMKSDKVFDVIGRQFENISLPDIIMNAVAENRADEEANDLGGRLTAEQVRAIEAIDASLRGPGGDVASLLPQLLKQREHDQLHYLLPGYVRSFIEKTTPRLHIRIGGDLNSTFHLEDLPRQLEADLDEATEGKYLPMTVNKPPPDQEVLFLRPGEPFFESYRTWFCDHAAGDAWRGAIFLDPNATEPYLYHLARVSTSRAADPALPETFGEAACADMRLVALCQPVAGQPAECPVELLMTLRAAEAVYPGALPSHQKMHESLSRAQAYLEDLARQKAEDIRRQLLTAVEGRSEFVTKGFDLETADVITARTDLTRRIQSGDSSLAHRLEDVKKQQESLRTRKDRALQEIAREPELIQPGEIKLLAHALVLPTSDPEDQKRYDKQIELVAVRQARAYEEQVRHARVTDVSTSEFALQAGLSAHPGFDLISDRPDGTRLCIEVKGRAAIGQVELTENEWPQAVNLGSKYWLYAVFNCALATPTLYRVQDPFAKLLRQIKERVVFDQDSIIEASEKE